MGLHVERLSPRIGDWYEEEGADPGWVGLVVAVDGGEVCVSRA